MFHGFDHVSACTGVECGEVEQVAGVVVDEVEDVDAGAVCQVEVCDVCLPAFVGAGCFESDVGRAWTFLGLWGYQAGVGEDSADC